MRTTNRTFALIAGLLLLALPAGAQSLELETFRADLLGYVRALGALPSGLNAEIGIDSGSLLDAEDSIEALTLGELTLLKEQLDKVPYWREVPRMLNHGLFQAATTGGMGVLSPRDLAFEMGLAARGLNVEGIRSSLLGLVGSFRAVPVEMVSPEYFARIERVEAAVRSASAEELFTLSQAIEHHAPAWGARLDQGGAEAVASSEGFVSVMNHCSGAFPSNIICELGHIIISIAAIPGKVETFATNAVNAIKTSLLNFLEGIGPALEGAVDFVIEKLSDVDWAKVATVVGDNIRLPCPPDTFILPGFGKIGDIRTSVNWDRGIGFAGNTIAAVMPGDMLTSVNIQMIAHIINFPIQWLSRCFREAYEEKYDLAQLAHRKLVEDRLNTTVSSRATQTSVDGANSQVVNIDGDVVKVEAKLDRLDGTLDRIETGTITLNGTLGRIESRSEDIEGQVDDIESTTETLITETDVVETKVDRLQLQQDETNDLLFNMRIHFLRMLIEADLYRNGPERIGLFALPQTGTMGLLEMARQIVADTLSSRAAAGDGLGQAHEWLADGDDQYNRGNYKSAYASYQKAYQSAIN
ncbi:MAG TPA: hypothetical protein VMS56_03345 [Thermoanaerobaculia bacterium]|nr:hypothetical protein [Thermoanaerobaculia bacterium]